MSKKIQNSASGTPAARTTDAEQVREFAQTLALQKTEWANLRGASVRFVTLRSKRHKRSFVGVFFALPRHDIEADIDRWTFLVDGRDIDDYIADFGDERA